MTGHFSILNCLENRSLCPPQLPSKISAQKLPEKWSGCWYASVQRLQDEFGGVSVNRWRHQGDRCRCTLDRWSRCEQWNRNWTRESDMSYFRLDFALSLQPPDGAWEFVQSWLVVSDKQQFRSHKRCSGLEKVATLCLSRSADDVLARWSRFGLLWRQSGLERVTTCLLRLNWTPTPWSTKTNHMIQLNVLSSCTERLCPWNQSLNKFLRPFELHILLNFEFWPHADSTDAVNFDSIFSLYEN